MKLSSIARAIALVAALLACASGAGLAQMGTIPPRDSFAPSASLDSMLVLIEIRPAQAVQQDLQMAQVERSAAQLRFDRGKGLQTRAQMQIELKKSEIGVLEARASLAKSEKNVVLEDELKRQKKMAELEKTLLEKREELRKKEIELAKAEIEHATASNDALERELDLAGLREQRATLAGLPANPELVKETNRLDVELRDLQDRTLEAMVRAYERLEKVAKQEVSVNKARRNVLSAQTKLLESAGMP